MRRSQSPSRCRTGRRSCGRSTRWLRCGCEMDGSRSRWRFASARLKLALAHDLTERRAAHLQQPGRRTAAARSLPGGARPRRARIGARAGAGRPELGAGSSADDLGLERRPGAVGLTRWSAERSNTSELLQLAYLPQIARIQAARGDDAGLRRAYELALNAGSSTNAEYDYGPSVARAIALNATGSHREALDAALPIAVAGSEIANEDRREAYVEAGLAALALDDQQTVEHLIASVQALAPAMRSPLLRAGAARFERPARAAARRPQQGRRAPDGGDARAPRDRGAVRTRPGAARARRGAARGRTHRRCRAAEGRGGHDLRAAARGAVARTGPGARRPGGGMRSPS